MFAIYYLGFILCTIAGLTRGTDFYRVGNFVETNSTNSTRITRLPDTVKPWAYDLTITPDLKTFKFNGSVIIKVTILKSTNEILLHSKDLEIDSVVFKSSNGSKLDTSYILDPENDLLHISIKSGILANKTSWEIYINYSGKLNDDMRGFYRSSYTVGSTTKWLAATQFEATFARMAFPCFDEPRFKARFRICVYTEPHQSVISNMPKLYARAERTRIRHQFSSTPRMPTYLVSFMVSEMSNITDSKRKYSVWARENAIEDASYALSIGPKFIQAMENYTSILYTLPKMDLVAIPDFGAGAMENWGMITFRESAMLFNKTVGSEKNLERVTQVIAHETVHQWFGDYVTPYWWDYLWLNEGFARYFEYKITAMVLPTWRMDEYFVVNVQQPVLFDDEAYVHHAMTSSVQTPAEIDDMFDTISYAKGASVLRMLEYMVTPKIFRKALNKYLSKRYRVNGLAQPSDLWKAFDIYCKNSSLLPRGFTVSDIMTKWTTYSGYPLITVSRLLLSPRKNVILLEQEPYDATYRSASDRTLPKNQTWMIPVSYTTNYSNNFMNTKPTLWLMPGQKSVVNEYLSTDEWIILNLQQTGYYRVNYDLKNWQLLIQQLVHDPSTIHVLNRAQLLDDSWALAIDNKLPFSIPFALTRYLVHEEDVLPWFSAINKFEYVYSLFENTCLKGLLRSFFLEHLTYLHNRLGFHVKETDDHMTKVLRNSVISLAFRLGSKECSEYAEHLFKENLPDLSKVPADLKAVAFCAAFNNEHFSESQVWAELWSLYSRSNSAHEKETLLYAVGCMQCRGHLKKYIRKLVNKNDHDIRKQDRIFVYRAIFSTSYGVTAALQYVDDAARNITTIESEEMQVIVRLLGYTTRRITTQDQVNILKRLNTEAEMLTGKISKRYSEAVKTAYELGLKKIERISNRHDEIHTLLSSSKDKSAGYSLTSSASSLILMLAGWLIYFQA